jgi:hypothetical protein
VRQPQKNKKTKKTKMASKPFFIWSKDMPRLSICEEAPGIGASLDP